MSQEEWGIVELMGHVILSALESGLTISQLKELAITLRGDAW